MGKPFAHDELEIKQRFLEQARKLSSKNDDFASELSAALLYMNLADYLAEYITVSLSEMAKEAMSKYYLGIVTIKPQRLGNFNIGTSMAQLRTYEFPRKQDIMDELEKINEARKHIAHQMLKTNSSDFDKIDNAIKDIAEHTEKLVDIVDEISLGMPPQTLIDKFKQENAESEIVNQSEPTVASEDSRKSGKNK